MSDPFGAKNQLEKLSEELGIIDEESIQNPDYKEGWHVPFWVNGFASELMFHWNQFLGNLSSVGGLENILEIKEIKRSPKEKLEIEGGRAYRFSFIFEELKEKYQTASRTHLVLKNIEKGKTGFVLFLREFNFKTNYLNSGSFGGSTSKKYDAEKKRIEYAKAIKPIPLIWVSNPSDSEAFNSTLRESRRDDDPSYRIQMDDNWEADIEKLIKASSFIIIANEDMTPGISAEIELVKKLNRLKDTYYLSPEKAEQQTGKKNKGINNEVLRKIRSNAEVNRAKPKSLPKPTSLWLSGESRKDGHLLIQQSMDILERLGQLNMQNRNDLVLDCYFYLLGGLIMLESTHQMISVLDDISFLYSLQKKKELVEKNKFIAFYSQLSDRLFNFYNKNRNNQHIQKFNLVLFSNFENSLQEKFVTFNKKKKDLFVKKNASEIFIDFIKKIDCITELNEKITVCKLCLMSKKLKKIERGFIYGILGAGFYEKGIKSIEKDNIGSSYSGISYEADDYLTKSIRYYSKSIEIEPIYYMNYWNRGFVYELLNQRRLALEDYTMTLKIEPKFTKGYLYRSNILSKIGKARLALVDLNKAKELEPRNKNINKLIRHIKELHDV